VFTRSARFYDALYSWKDYPGETAKLVALIRERNPNARTLLDVACGTGKHLELLQEHFEVEGVDLDPDMLSIARKRLPGVPLHHGDMRELDLGRTFDVVTCLFSSIAYTRTVAELSRAIMNMARHLRAGGVHIVEPFFAPEQWQPGHPWALFVDEPDLKIARMDVAWPLENSITTIEFHYLVATPEGVEHMTERHDVALFTEEELRRAFHDAGLEPEIDPEGLMGRGLYIAAKPG
jgi:ubiquinone/menaquinone biosynthesis C-methylase UbiE